MRPGNNVKGEEKSSTGEQFTAKGRKRNEAERDTEKQTTQFTQVLRSYIIAFNRYRKTRGSADGKQQLFLPLLSLFLSLSLSLSFAFSFVCMSTCCSEWPVIGNTAACCSWK